MNIKRKGDKFPKLMKFRWTEIIKKMYEKSKGHVKKDRTGLRHL